MQNLNKHYLAILLSPDAKSQIRSSYQMVHPKRYAHHATIAFNPTVADLQAWPVDTELKMIVLSHGYDDNAQALRVAIVHNGRLYLHRPDHFDFHITLSAATAPKDSNFIPNASFKAEQLYQELWGTVKLVLK